MNKTELTNVIAAGSGLSKANFRKALEASFSLVTKALSTGDKVSLVGFGIFSVAERAERSGINSSTKKVVITPAKKVAKFRLDAKLADAIK